MGKKLYDWDRDLDPELLDEFDEDVRWYAETTAARILFTKMTVVRRTPKGMWLTTTWNSEGVWRSNDSRKASLTRRDALYHLWRRKVSHTRHAERRLEAAYRGERTARRALNDTGSALEAPRSKFFYTPRLLEFLEEP